MDVELFYHLRNRRNPLSAICLQTDGLLFQYLLRSEWKMFLCSNFISYDGNAMSFKLLSFIGKLNIVCVCATCVCEKDSGK